MAEVDYASKLFDDREAAEAALARLEKIGYGTRDISLVLSRRDMPVDSNFASDTSPLAARGTLGGVGTMTGAVAGGILGAVVAAAVSAAMIIVTEGAALPFVAGPVVAALGGFGAGVVGGTIVGGLLELGIEAEDWGPGLAKGGVGVIVRLKTRADESPVRTALLHR